MGRDGAVFLTVFGSVPMTVCSAVIMVVASFTMAELSYEQQTQDLRARATVDGLTGLLNRTAFLDLAKDELRRLNRARTSASLILADLDHFKGINDEYGHSAGDAALQAFADACTSTVRSTDLVGRYGGEEFIILLPGVTPERAGEIASDISARMQASTSPVIPRLPTSSYGIASTAPGRVDLDAHDRLRGRRPLPRQDPGPGPLRPRRRPRGRAGLSAAVPPGRPEQDRPRTERVSPRAGA